MSSFIYNFIHTLGLYSLPIIENSFVKETIEDETKSKNVIIFSKEEIKQLDLKTGLGASRVIDEAIDENSEYVYIPGALTNSVIADIHPKKFKKVKFVLKDPTKIFIDSIKWGQLKKQGFCVEVLRNIKVAAITVNPFAPLGYSFEHKALIDAMQLAAENVPVVDVKYNI